MTLSAIQLLSLVAFVRGFTINPPANLPTDASPAVDRGYLGLQIESTSFPSYTGSKANPNTFSLNMFGSIANRTGFLPIRVGGDSRDVGIYVPSQTAAVAFPYGTGRGLMSPNTIGNPWFDGLSMIPNARWVLGVPFQSKNLSNAIEFLRYSLTKFPIGSLDAIEIGNEVNEYGPSYSPQDYVDAWHTWVTAILGNLTTIPTRSFWALSDADGVGPGNKWDAEAVYKNTTFGSYTQYTKAISMHYYQIYEKSQSIQADLLTHSATVQGINGTFSHDVAYLKTLSPSVPLILGEVGAGGGGTGNDTQAATLRNSLGSAVWWVGFHLQCMSVGIQRTNIIAGLDGPDLYGIGSAWLPAGPPDGTAPAKDVGTSFYAQILIADIFKAIQGTLRIAPQTVTPNNGKLSAGSIVSYAAYDSGKLSKVVVLNEQVWNSTESSSRPSANITIAGLSGSTATLQYLTGPDAESSSGVTWAGQQWSVSDGLPRTVTSNTRSIAISKGQATFEIAATEVIVVSL